MTVKFNFKDGIDFLDDIGDSDMTLSITLEMHHRIRRIRFAVEKFLKLIGDNLTSILLRDSNTSMDFTIPADESTDDRDFFFFFLHTTSYFC